jgi:hypothetical protein
MPDDFDLPDEYDFDEDVALDADEKNVGGTQQEWLKLTQKGQNLRGAFIYFHTYDSNAVRAAVKIAKKEGNNLTREQIVALADKALKQRAEELGKSKDQLSALDKLDISIAHFKAMKMHYQDGLGYTISRLGKDGAEADAIWKRLPEPKTTFSTLLLIYPTDSEGSLQKDTLTKQIKEKKLKEMPWRFSTRVYDDIWKLNDGLRQNNLSLASQDIMLECNEPKYQNISVRSAGPAWWLKNETFKEAVLTQAINFYDKLVPFREMTTDQLRAKLGLGGSGAEDVSTDDFQGMLDQV